MRASSETIGFSGISPTLPDHARHRRYLTADERGALLSMAEGAPTQAWTFCALLAHSGCRISEALALTADRVRLDEGVIIFEPLKKRRPGTYRPVPAPEGLLEIIDLVHGIRDAQARRDGGQRKRLWPWSRMTGWRRVIEVLVRATARGPHAMPRGLRHGFGLAAIRVGFPPNFVQRWLGHAQLSTTAIYADAMGTEEHGIASRQRGSPSPRDFRSRLSRAC